ncbi:MAG: hypothetical protein M1836_005983 [Candelina mexicana]|nr:MAG: hypothetical protein M1836_005983 [Candelina mexicana]
MKLSLLASSLLCINPLVSGAPYIDHIGTEDHTIARAVDQGAPLKGKTLKILPLGDSITNGYQSSDGNGYRKDLLDAITLYGGAKATFIGSLKSGKMQNNENEGHDSAKIDAIAGAAKTFLKQTPNEQKPNVVLLHAGTNDMIQNYDVDDAPERLGKLLDEITTTVPDAVVLVAQIIPNRDPSIDKRIQAFNSNLWPMLKGRQDKQHKDGNVQIFDMHKAVPVADLGDGTHPTDKGYKEMARAWYFELQEVAKNGLMDDPIFTKPQ